MEEVSLTLRQKQTFYHELGQFLRTGIPLPQAVDALLPDTPGGPMRQTLERLHELFRQGETVDSAFAKMKPMITELEATLVEAANASGRLEQAFVYLSGYFDSLAGVRAGIIKQITWPLVQLHLAIFVVGLPSLVGGGSGMAYLVQTGSTLAVLYGVVFVLGSGIAMLLKEARHSTALDALLRRIPLLGTLRRNLALSRFCAVYEMQLQAAINVMDGLRSAAAASQSALLESEIERIIPQVRGGAQVGGLLAGSRAIPNALQRVIRIGEDTGSLDEDLRKWSEYYRNQAVVNMETIGNWLPRLIFLGVAVYVGYVVISAYSQSLGDMKKILDE